MMKYQAVRWFLGGVLVIGISVTQAVFGWVGDGVYYRWVYPVLLLVGSSVFFWVGYQAWNYNEETSEEKADADHDTAGNESP